MLEVKQILSLRGRRSRNKVTVDESAVGSLTPKLIPLALVLQLSKTMKMKIFNGGYLGSHIEEERSELR
jgi:hypothetical protein